MITSALAIGLPAGNPLVIDEYLTMNRYLRLSAAFLL
jgi:hypothetical protein